MSPGDGLAHRGNVVAVSVNQCLGALGFGNLMDYGEQYASSANVGMLDLVLALHWVKTNISNFGGEPNNVLIFDQSGGDGKVSTLIGMPSAQGLFHRAVVESGSMLGDRSREESARVMAGVLAELGLNKSAISRIHEFPYQKIIEAAVHAQHVFDAYGFHQGLGWGPVVDGTILPRTSWTPDAPSYSKNVPMIISNTRNEFFNSVQMEDASLNSMSMDEAWKRLSGRCGNFSHFATNLGKGADHVIEVFCKVCPSATPVEMFSVISAMLTMRINALEQSKRKAEQGSAPAYNYWFQWQTPVLDGQPRAFHCSELPFVFYYTEVCGSMTGGGPEALDLAGRMGDAWISFARTGSPNHRGLPHRPAYDAAKIPTMIFDNQCVVKDDPDGEIRKVILEVRA